LSKQFLETTPPAMFTKSIPGIVNPIAPDLINFMPTNTTPHFSFPVPPRKNVLFWIDEAKAACENPCVTLVTGVGTIPTPRVNKQRQLPTTRPVAGDLLKRQEKNNFSLYYVGTHIIGGKQPEPAKTLEL
jgi:hypothetical protein